MTNAYAYDSYGTAEESVESLAQRFRYTGREFDALTGLYHYRARAYDPQTGRFLQEDPIWFEALDLNVYRYVGGNPLNGTDPTGMFQQAGERSKLYAVASGAAAGLTLRAVRVAALLWRMEGTKRVLFVVAKELTLQRPRGLGCQIGANLSAIGATLFNAMDISFSPDGCSVTWDKPPVTFAPNDPADPPVSAPPTKPKPEPKPKDPKPLPPPVPGPKPRPDPTPDPTPPGKGPGDDDGSCNLPPLYRAINLSEISWRTNGIFATEALEETDIVTHILDLDEGSPSSWISTSKSYSVAKNTYAIGANYGGVIVRIDRCKLPSKIVDVSNGGTGSSAADFLAIRDQEVLVRFYIPANAISIAGR